MDYKEEQEQEIEALESIYMDDFNLIEKDKKYEINLKNENFEEEGKKVEIKFIVEYTDKYPEEKCYFNISSSDLTRTENENLVFSLEKEIEENIGNVYIFNLTSFIQEYLNEYNSKKEEENEFKKIQKEKEDEKERLSKLNRFIKDNEFDKVEEGNPVTLENFAEWKLKFDKEKETKKIKKIEISGNKLTGKQYFEKKLEFIDSEINELKKNNLDEEIFDDDLFLE
eukprot:gene9889-2211_t